jgi:hypothetical protein
MPRGLLFLTLTAVAITTAAVLNRAIPIDSVTSAVTNYCFIAASQLKRTVRRASDDVGFTVFTRKRWPSLVTA